MDLTEDNLTFSRVNSNCGTRCRYGRAIFIPKLLRMSACAVELSNSLLTTEGECSIIVFNAIVTRLGQFALYGRVDVDAGSIIVNCTYFVCNFNIDW